jgi:molybdate transport system substrate-binding protein
MKKTVFAILAAALLAWAGGTGAGELIVSAAASLTNAFAEIGREFEQSNPPHKVIFNFASSGALLQQISRGAPVDVFASADQDTMDRADRQSLIVRSSRVDFTRNTLVLVMPAGAATPVSHLQELRKEAIRRIAISNTETVPVGKYSRQALQAAGLFDELKDKYINTQNVRQSLDYVARGEVDAGFVYMTDAAVMADRVRVVLEVPTQTPVSYPIAVVKGSGKENLAMRFVSFVRSDSGQRILRKHGFRAMD